MTRVPVRVSGAGAGMRAFSGILGGAPVPPPMAYVPLRPGTGSVSYGAGAFCSRHSRPVHRADLVSGVHRPGTPGIIDTAWASRSSRNTPAPVLTIHHRQICCHQCRSRRCTPIQNHGDNYCHCYDVSDILLRTPATVAVMRGGEHGSCPNPHETQRAACANRCTRCRTRMVGRAAGLPTTVRFIAGMCTINHVKFGGDHTGIGRESGAAAHAPAATDVLCR